MPDFLVQTVSILMGNVVPALIVLTAVVFVHEMGHFLVARWCGIRVAAFSIGFGPELAGFQRPARNALEDQRHSTRRIRAFRG
jgi:regulator of sigma E protease